jgi:hypothetical protein
MKISAGTHPELDEDLAVSVVFFVKASWSEMEHILPHYLGILRFEKNKFSAGFGGLNSEFVLGDMNGSYPPWNIGGGLFY